jgi:hypothetical protein
MNINRKNRAIVGLVALCTGLFVNSSVFAAGGHQASMLRPLLQNRKTIVTALQCAVSLGAALLAGRFAYTRTIVKTHAQEIARIERERERERAAAQSLVNADDVRIGRCAAPPGTRTDREMNEETLRLYAGNSEGQRRNWERELLVRNDYTWRVGRARAKLVEVPLPLPTEEEVNEREWDNRALNTKLATFVAGGLVFGLCELIKRFRS